MKNTLTLFIKLAAIAAVLAPLFLLTGCATSEEESTLPWSKPAAWEGSKLPGMGSGYGERTY